MVILWLLVRVLIHTLSFLSGKIKRKSITSCIVVALIGCIIILAVRYVNKKIDISFLLAGLGVLNDDVHSSGTRIDAMMRALSVFEYHPWIGVSLGGVDPFVAKVYGIVFENGMSQCVWVEVLVASGIIGMIFFVLWIFSIIKNIKKKYKENIYTTELLAVMWGLVFECIILSFNQNILRVYFWILIGIVSAMSKLFERKV